MRRVLISTLVFLLLLGPTLVIENTAEAGGIGFYLNNGSGTAEYSDDDGTYTIDVDTKFSGYGLILDSNVSKDKVYNGRITFGPETMTLSTSEGDIDLTGIALHSDFGFGGTIADFIRLWGGFQFRFALYNKAEADDVKKDASMAGFGIGPVLGINIIPIKVITFSLKTGYVFAAYSGDIDDYSYKIQQDQHYFFNAGLIFRFGSAEN